MDWENSVSKIINGEKNPNYIIDLQENLLSDDIDTVLSSLKAIEMLFCHFLKTKELCADNDIPDYSSQRKYKDWLKNQYDDCKTHLIDHLHHENEDVQKMCLKVLMSFVKSEVDTPLTNVPENEWWFPKKLYTLIISHIIQNESPLLIECLKDYVQFDDAKFYTLKALNDVLKPEEVNDQNLRNIFLILCKTRFPKSFHDISSDDPPIVFFEKTDSKPFIVKENAFKNIFSSVWIAFLKKKMSKVLQRKVLLYLPKQVLPNLSNPLLLTDLFTDAYNIGGIISLLALNGIFFLIQKYNLEYPNFFKKLYNLLDVNVIKSKYRARFFFLSDIFLSSILLPEYIVAAFVKKLSRLSLYATPDLLLIILPFIRNLLIRHRGLKHLIHKQQTLNLEEDPYNFEEQDIEKCNALQSSLWEIKALQNHWHPDVSTKANFINSDVNVIETDISSVLDYDFDELIKKEKKVKFTECSLSVEIFSQKDVKISWSL